MAFPPYPILLATAFRYHIVFIHMLIIHMLMFINNSYVAILNIATTVWVIFKAENSQGFLFTLDFVK